MPRLERDQHQPIDSRIDQTRDAPAHPDPSSEADESASHIAALVRRTTERHGRPGPPPAAHPEAMAAHPPQAMVPQVTAPQGAVPQVTAPQGAVLQMTAPPIAHPVAPQIAPADAQAPRRVMWPPSRRILVTAGVAVVLLVGGGVAVSQSVNEQDAVPPASAPGPDAPAGYAVKVTEVTNDCAGHSRGRTKASFEDENCVTATRLLATGAVSGRPVLFVVSRITMATGEAAASVKQVLDGNGTGNLNDLLREDKTYPGAPAEMPISGYASVQKGNVVAVAEAGFVDNSRSSNSDPALRSAAADVAEMVSTQG